MVKLQFDVKFSKKAKQHEIEALKTDLENRFGNAEIVGRVGDLEVFYMITLNGDLNVEIVDYISDVLRVIHDRKNVNKNVKVMINDRGDL